MHRRFWGRGRLEIEEGAGAERKRGQDDVETSLCGGRVCYAVTVSRFSTVKLNDR